MSLERRVVKNISEALDIIKEHNNTPHDYGKGSNNLSFIVEDADFDNIKEEIGPFLMGDTTSSMMTTLDGVLTLFHKRSAIPQRNN